MPNHRPEGMEVSVTWLKDLKNDAYIVGAKWLHQSLCHGILLHRDSSAPHSHLPEGELAW